MRWPRTRMLRRLKPKSALHAFLRSITWLTSFRITRPNISVLILHLICFILISISTQISLNVLMKGEGDGKSMIFRVMDPSLLKTSNLHEVKHWVEPGEAVTSCQMYHLNLNLLSINLFRADSIRLGAVRLSRGGEDVGPEASPENKQKPICSMSLG